MTPSVRRGPDIPEGYMRPRGECLPGGRAARPPGVGVHHFGGRGDLDTAWGVCSSCGSEDRLDVRTGLCPSCAGRAPPPPLHPAQPTPAPSPGAPATAHARAYPPPPYPGTHPAAYPFAYPEAYPSPYPPAYPAAYPAAYPPAYPAPYPAPYPTAYPYQYPYAYPAPYYGQPSPQAEADSTATLGIVLGFIGLMIVFPFGFVSIVLGAIGMLLSWSGLQRGARQGRWGLLLGLFVIVLGGLGTVILLTAPPIW